MPSGPQLAKQNLNLFEQWKKDREAAQDYADFIRGSILNRTRVAAACGFALSAITQNPAIKASLASLEDKLREDGTLPKKKPKTSENASDAALRERTTKQKDRAENRVKALEEKNALLKAEVQELRGMLKKYEFMEKHLAETGRVLKF